MKKLQYILILSTVIFYSCQKQNPNIVNSDLDYKSEYPSGSIFGPGGATVIIDVTNPVTGNTWMDRNLGATEVATSSQTENSFGFLYQWGRMSDGHQLRTSGSTYTLSNTRSTAGNSLFILAPKFPFDWKNPQVSNIGIPLEILWQGVNGINNPCPKGYRLPTEAEWEAERKSWKSNDAAGALASPLKLPLAGYRNGNPQGGAIDGSIINGGAYYWTNESISKTANNNIIFFSSRILIIGPTYANMLGSFVIPSGNDGNARGARAFGACIRCIKD